MMKIIDYVVKTSIVLAALLIMGYFFPVVSWFEKPQPRKNMVSDVRWLMVKLGIIL